MRAGVTVVAALVALCLSGWPAASGGVEVRAEPIGAFEPRAPRETVFGGVRFLGGLVLSSPDDRFGGYSGLEMSADGARLVMVSDVGTLLHARVERSQDGRAAGLADVSIHRLRGVDGRALTRKREADAEAVRAVDGAGLGEAVYVSFERLDRILRYPLDTDGAPGVPELVGRFDLPENRGIEAVAVLPGGDMVAIAERPHDRPGLIAGWIHFEGARSRFDVRQRDRFYITDAVTLPDGRLVLLERRFSILGGLHARLRVVAQGGIAPGAVVDGDVVLTALWWRHQIDNLEGLAVHEEDGRTVLTVVSDDNFSFLQRTVLLEFELLD